LIALGLSTIAGSLIFKLSAAVQAGRRDVTDPATPMMEPSSTAYIENESIEWGKLVVSFEPKNSMPTG
jgi:hypothetical protein